jgi:hypothetical protein
MDGGMSSLLHDVETFLTKHQMPPTNLGDAALGDRHFVRQLRNGRRVWPETEAKVRTFMARHGRQGSHCGLCNEARAAGEIAACIAVDCPLREREAA